MRHLIWGSDLGLKTKCYIYIYNLDKGMTISQKKKKVEAINSKRRQEEQINLYDQASNEIMKKTKLIRTKQISLITTSVLDKPRNESVRPSPTREKWNRS